MTVRAWRIVKRRHLKNAFSGGGARLFPGRWNSVGVPMVYNAGSQALAALEIVVLLEGAELLERYVVFEVDIDSRLIARPELPAARRHLPGVAKCRAIGDAWIASGNTAVLQIPSAIVPGESNYLLNPRHRDFSKLKISPPVPFRFDPRLAG